MMPTRSSWESAMRRLLWFILSATGIRTFKRFLSAGQIEEHGTRFVMRSLSTPRFCLVVIITLLTASCATTPLNPATAQFSSLNDGQRDVYLAAIHWMVGYGSDLSHHYGFPVVYFVQLKGHDAPSDLLELLNQEGYKVKPGSHWREGEGVRLDLNEITIKSSSKVSVEGGFLYGSLGAEWGPIVLVRREGKWFFISFTVELLS
jgi:hypothetical protein